jgi:hypothetical protein
VHVAYEGQHEFQRQDALGRRRRRIAQFRLEGVQPVVEAGLRRTAAGRRSRGRMSEAGRVEVRFRKLDVHEVPLGGLAVVPAIGVGPGGRREQVVRLQGVGVRHQQGLDPGLHSGGQVTPRDRRDDHVAFVAPGP